VVLLLLALLRAGFEPLWWRRNQGLSLRIDGRAVFLGRHHNPHRGSKPARIGTAEEPHLGRAEFFALPTPGSDHALPANEPVSLPRTQIRQLGEEKPVREMK